METSIWIVLLVAPLLFGSLAVGIVMIVGAVKMMRLQSRGWAMTASVLALLPSPVSLLGLVMGIWSLVVLNRRNVRLAFDAQRTSTSPRGSANSPPAQPGETARATVGAGHDRVIGPAIGLAVTGILSLPVAVMILVGAWRFLAFGQSETWLEATWPLPFMAAVLLIPFLIVVGAAKMFNLTSSRWARTAALLALSPIPSGPFWLIGLPIGIWALAVLGKPEVKEAFRAADAERLAGRRAGSGRLWLAVAAIVLVLAIAVSPFALPAVYFFLNRAPSADPDRGVGSTVEPNRTEPKRAEPDSNPPDTAAPPTHPFGYVELMTVRRMVDANPRISPPTQVAFSADRTKLIALIGDSVYSWNAGTETSLGRKQLGNFAEAVVSGTLAPNGDLITIVRVTGAVELWDMYSEQSVVGVIVDRARRALFSPDRRTVAVASVGTPLALWDVANNRERSKLQTDLPVTALAFTADGSLLAGGFSDGTVRLWEVASGELVTTFQGSSSPLTCLAFSPDGAKLAAGQGDGAIHITAIETGRREATINGPPRPCSLAFSPNAIYLAAGTEEGTVTKWQAPDWREREEHPPEPPAMRLVRAGLIQADANHRFVGLAVQGNYAYLTQDQSLRVVDVTEPPRPRIAGSCDLTSAAARVVVSGSFAYCLGKEHLHVVDIGDPAAPRLAGSSKSNEPEDFRDVAVQGKYAYVVDARTLRVIDVSNPAAPTEVGSWKPGREFDAFEGIAVSGQYAYVADDTEGLRVIEIFDPRAPKEAAAFEGPGNALHIALAGNRAFIAGGEDGVALWIVDISDPKGPKPAGQFGDWITGGGVAIQDGVAYLLGGELDLVDVSDPATPRRLGTYQAVGDPGEVVGWSLAVSGNHVYVVSEAGFSVLRAVQRGGR